MSTCLCVFIVAELRQTAISYEGAQIWQALKMLTNPLYTMALFRAPTKKYNIIFKYQLPTYYILISLRIYLLVFALPYGLRTVIYLRCSKATNQPVHGTGFKPQ